MSSGGSYDPHAIEGEIYRFWEEDGHFHAQPNPAKRPYVIDIPLPNVTGALHLGHALNDTMQDILIRHKRMCGFEAMWMPGTDHAGIATQAVVERRMKEEEGKTRHDIGRDALVKRIWDWKEKYGEQILMQLRRMGFSCDWTRTRFTLDEICAKAVYEVFFQWFKAGLIYRGTRLVNWDAHLQTAVADDEVIYETVKGHFWHYRYPILPSEPEAPARGTLSEPEAAARGTPAIEGSRDQGIKDALARAVAPDAKYGVDYLSIATTRPETMLGDTAICVHPDDPRYEHLVGRKCLLPLMNRAIPIIADGELAKMEMGTGCVKVTPGHDPKDYACGLRHNLPMINILTPDGKINENGREKGSRDQGIEGSRKYEYVGLDRYEARKRVVADLEALGLMEKIEPYETEVGHSDRSKTPIEPMLSEQWFMRMGELAESAMDAVRDGRVRFFPERYAKTYLDWLGEKRDWCISRQLWWGHRIPVWTKRMSLREKSVLCKARADAVSLAGPFPDGVFIRVARDNGQEFELGRGMEPDTETYYYWMLKEVPQDEPLSWRVCLRDMNMPWGIEPRPEDQTWTPPRVQPLSAADWLSQLGFERDPDVLDTWFSSALWPFSTLGWPHEESDLDPSIPRSPDPSLPSLADFDYFYPTSTLVTGRGIITLWVARMVMTGLYFTGRVPFRHVHIHPIIQDGQGRTMSKSLGNGVDPLDIIALYGTDALRFTMAQMDTETQDVRMPVKPVKMPDGRTVNSSEKFELGRNFCNKVWQAATGFVLANLADNEAARQHESEPEAQARVSAADDGTMVRPLTLKDLALEDHWILSRLSATIAEVDRRLAAYQISEVTNTLREFFWSDFCDWYVELVKPRLFGRDEGGEMVQNTDDSARVARQVLAWVLDQSLRLLHPIMPFVTEALWKKLNEAAPRRGINKLIDGEPALIRATWPDASAWPRNADIEAELAALQNVIRGLRDTLAWINTTRAASKTPAIGKLPRALIRAPEALAAGLREQASVISRLGRCEALEIGPDLAKPAESATKVFGGVELFVPIAGLADLAVERERLSKERGQLVEHIGRIESKLANDGFVAKAPPAVVEKERARAAELREQLAALEGHLAEIATH